MTTIAATPPSSLTDGYLDWCLRYQQQEGVHTMGYCANGCGNGARGGRVCVDCLNKEIERRKAVSSGKVLSQDGG